MEMDDSPDGPPDIKKEGHKPDVKSVKADKASVNVDQWDKWSVDSFDNLDKWSPEYLYTNGRADEAKV